MGIWVSDIGWLDRGDLDAVGGEAPFDPVRARGR
jgi:hypothetical protein